MRPERICCKMHFENDRYDLKTLLRLFEKKATSDSDGHFTIMRFSTGWRVMFGTPELTKSGREDIVLIGETSNMEEGIIKALI